MRSDGGEERICEERLWRRRDLRRRGWTEEGEEKGRESKIWWERKLGIGWRRMKSRIQKDLMSDIGEEKKDLVWFQEFWNDGKLGFI